jgi:hypothetical protein
MMTIGARRANRRGTLCGAMVAALLAGACRPAVEPPEVVQKTGVRQRAAGTPTIRETRRRAQDLASIASEWRNCRETNDTPFALQQCDSQTSAAANGIVRRSDGNSRLDELFPDLFEPLLYARTGGDDALAERVVVTSAYAEFAQRRAAILTGVAVSPPARAHNSRSLDSLLGRVAERQAAHSFARRWEAIRNADCVAYPVPNCAARLDAAFRGMLEDLLSDE